MSELFDQRPALTQHAEDDGTLVRKAIEADRKSDSACWEQADVYAELAARGWTQEKIAAECLSTQSKVSRFIACTQLCKTHNSRGPFAEAYKKVIEAPAAAKVAAKSYDQNICGRCNRMGGAIDGCQECKRVQEENRKAGKKKPSRGQIADKARTETRTENGQAEPEPQDDKADETKIVSGLYYVETRLNAAAERIRKTRNIPKGTVEQALAKAFEAMTDVWRLWDAEIRKPWRKNCEKCGYEILLAISQNNKWVALNGEPEFGGSFEIMNGVAVSVHRDGKTKLYKMHHDSCSSSKHPVFAEE